MVKKLAGYIICLASLKNTGSMKRGATINHAESQVEFVAVIVHVLEVQMNFLPKNRGASEGIHLWISS